MAIEPIISVVISTFNRDRLLHRALESLCKQSIGNNQFEVIVVDNNSKDDTRNIVRQFKSNGTRVRYYIERKQGASYGKNRGIKEAKGEYVAFIDDDCVVPSQWLAIAYTIIKKESPIVFGGSIYPYIDKPLPKWYKAENEIHKPFNEQRVLSRNQYGRIYGGNMFCKLSVLHELNGFDPGYGPIGKKIGFSEETDLLKRIGDYFPEKKAIFNPLLYVYHTVDVNNLKFLYSIKSSFRAGRDVFRVWNDNHDSFNSRVDLVKPLLITLRNLLYELTVNIFRRNKIEYPYIRAYFHIKTLRHVRNLGKIYQQYLSLLNSQAKRI